MKKRVVHLITKLELGGAQINTIYTYENLDRDKFEVYLLSGKGGILDSKVKKRDNFKFLRHLVRPVNPVKDFLSLIEIIKIFRKIQPDLVHTHSSKAGIIGRIASFLTGVPCIHSVHGFAFASEKSSLRSSVYRFIEKVGSLFTSWFIFVADADLQAALKMKLVKSNYSVIRSGFPFEKFRDVKGDPDGLRERFDIPKGAFVCGVIAPFKVQKGLFHLLEIAAKVVRAEKRAFFLITGDGDLREELEAGIRELGLQKNFRLPGFVFDIENALSVFDIGVSTALWEGLPQSLVQMRICKKAVVASDIPGNREVIKDGLNGFTVFVEDYEAFALKIVGLIRNSDLRDRLGQYGDDMSAWDAENMVRQQEELYADLIK